MKPTKFDEDVSEPRATVRKVNPKIDFTRSSEPRRSGWAVIDPQHGKADDVTYCRTKREAVELSDNLNKFKS